jgi:predicted ATP-grasp superfamily ATP-dependent carboligase
MRGRVLVTDGDQRAALACVRSLGKGGYECFVTGPEKGNLAASSRFCRGRAVLFDPGEDPRAFLDGLVAEVRRWKIEYLLPITEKSLRAVLPELHLFPGVRVPFPSHEVFARVSDKAQVLEAADRVGIDVPKQWEWRCREDAEEVMIREVETPLVVKPTRSVSRSGGGFRQTSVAHAASPDELRTWLETAADESFPALVQEWVKGEGAGVFVLLWGGILRGVVGHRRIREKPPSGGVSVMRESTAVEPGLLRQSLALLKELGWRDGVAMVEYRVDPESGRSWLMEINGRFWGSLQMAVDAGVDFPALLLECLSGNAPPEPVTGRPGVKTRWLLGDLDQLLLRLVRSRASLHVPPSFPGRRSAFLEFVRDFGPGVRLEVERTSDLRPSLVEAGSWLRALRR